MKQSNDLEISPTSLTVVSPESYRVAMYVKCSEDSERKKNKNPIFNDHALIWRPSLGNPKQILTQNGHSRNQEPIRGYIAQYNKCGLRCEGSKDSGRKKQKLPFRPPHSDLMPQRTPANIRIKLTLLGSRMDPWAIHFAADFYLHSNFSGWLRKTCV